MQNSRRRLQTASHMLHSSRYARPMSLNIYKRQNKPDERKASTSVPRQSIEMFRQKLNQLERNKVELEAKVRRFERDMRSRSPIRKNSSDLLL